MVRTRKRFSTTSGWNRITYSTSSVGDPMKTFNVLLGFQGNEAIINYYGRDLRQIALGADLPLDDERMVWVDSMPLQCTATFTLNGVTYRIVRVT